jgi:hypothetical protein
MKIISILLITLISFLITNVNNSLLFEIQTDREKCFVEELYTGSVMMIKWKVRGVDEPDQQKEKQFYGYIQVYILAEKTNRIIKREFLQSAKGKISIHSEEEGFYKICVAYHGGWSVPYPALMSLKINSDNMDEPDIKSAIKMTDIDPIHKKFSNILQAGQHIIEKQTNETMHEDDAAKLHIYSTKNYYYMAVIQVLVIMTVGIYQIFTFRKFLVNNNVI